MAPVLKTGIPERVSGVRIPPSPPCSLALIVMYQVSEIGTVCLKTSLNTPDSGGSAGGRVEPEHLPDVVFNEILSPRRDNSCAYRFALLGQVLAEKR